jgi:hypothetical protein
MPRTSELEALPSFSSRPAAAFAGSHLQRVASRKMLRIYREKLVISVHRQGDMQNELGLSPMA